MFVVPPIVVVVAALIWMRSALMADAVRRRRRCRHAPRHTERSLTTKFESDPWPGFSASSFMKHSFCVSIRRRRSRFM
jgi:hypothetical protein